jgi:hypothetical protein
VAGELHNPKAILANSNKPYLVINAVLVKDVFPLPLVDECLDTLAGNVWYSKLDANSAYWQVKIKPEEPDSLFNWAIGPSINPMLDCIKFP